MRGCAREGECRETGMMEYWNVGKMEYWNDGTMECWEPPCQRTARIVFSGFYSNIPMFQYSNIPFGWVPVLPMEG
jgi:hypothetical protein